MDCLLGIDIGTTGTKSALFSCDGSLLDSDYASYPVTYPQENWAEQNPEDWWDALVKTVRTVISRNEKTIDVRAMSLSTQGGCLLLLDDHFRPVYSAVSWLDSRAGEVYGLLQTLTGEDELYKTGGWPGINGLNLATIIWFREKIPDLYNKAHYFASTIDYINYRLTGSFSIDYTNLALTTFLDLSKRDWSEKGLNITGLTRSNVAEIVPSGTVIGTLTPQSADEIGLPEDVVLVSGAHDQYCANIGAGAVNIGDCVLSTGTAWVLTLTSDRMVYNENRTIHPCIHVLEKKYGLMTAVSSGGNSLNWFQNTFQPELSFEALSREAEKTNPGSDGLIFVPQNTYNQKKASFINIDTVHTLSHFTRAVFEGVALANKKHLDDFSEKGITINTMVMIGGGARSTIWPGIVADVSNIPVIVPEQTEAACAGAAILAAAGSGMYSSIEEASRQFTGGENKIISPVEKNVSLYAKAYQNLYQDS